MDLWLLSALWRCLSRGVILFNWLMSYSDVSVSNQRRKGVTVMQNKTLHIVSFALAIIGGLNWGLVGLFNFNLVEVILGGGSALSRIVYVLVGVASVYLLATHRQDCKTCGAPAHAGPMGTVAGS